MAVKTVTTVIFRVRGMGRDGKPINHIKRATDSIWRKVGGEEGMKAWLLKRDPRYSDDIDVTFERNEDIDPDKMRVRPELPED